MQGADTSSVGPLEAGWVAVGGGGDTGVRVGEIAVSSTAPAAPSWDGPVSQTDFTFLLAEGEGHKVMSPEGHFAFLELGLPGYEIGAWVEDGATEGNVSWATKFGAMKITRVTMSAQMTVEAWVKIPTSTVEGTIPIVYSMGGGSRYNADWQRERGTIIAASVDLTAGTVTLGSSWGDQGLGGLEGMMLDTWHHVAWVRDGSLATMYLDGEEIGSGEITKYGETVFELNQLTVAQNADHDQVTSINETPYLVLDQLRVTSAVLEPDDFLVGEDGEVEPEPDVVGCDFNKDGNKAITDVIALLIFMRDNPGDLGADFNGDGNAAITDAIAMLLAMRDGTCPDQLAQLSSVVDDDYLRVTRLESLTQDDIEYIEEMMSSMNLTEEQEAAFRVALYGRAGAAALPKTDGLAQNSPNPFNPSTTIGFTVAEGSAVHVSLKIYDIRGNLVRTLVNEVRDAGTYNVFWDGTDASGRNVASGVYFYRMTAGDFSQTRKMVLLK
jgi:flagellar hook assembly protein FlgD